MADQNQVARLQGMQIQSNFPAMQKTVKGEKPEDRQALPQARADRYDGMSPTAAGTAMVQEAGMQNMQAQSIASKGDLERSEGQGAVKTADELNMSASMKEQAALAMENQANVNRGKAKDERAQAEELMTRASALRAKAKQEREIAQQERRRAAEEERQGKSLIDQGEAERQKGEGRWFRFLGRGDDEVNQGLLQKRRGRDRVDNAEGIRSLAGMQETRAGEVEKQAAEMEALAKAKTQEAQALDAQARELDRKAATAHSEAAVDRASSKHLESRGDHMIRHGRQVKQEGLRRWEEAQALQAKGQITAMEGAQAEHHAFVRNYMAATGAGYPITMEPPSKGPSYVQQTLEHASAEGSRGVTELVQGKDLKEDAAVTKGRAVDHSGKARAKEDAAASLEAQSRELHLNGKLNSDQAQRIIEEARRLRAQAAKEREIGAQERASGEKEVRLGDEERAQGEFAQRSGENRWFHFLGRGEEEEQEGRKAQARGEGRIAAGKYQLGMAEGREKKAKEMEAAAERMEQQAREHQTEAHILEERAQSLEREAKSLKASAQEDRAKAEALEAQSSQEQAQAVQHTESGIEHVKDAAGHVQEAEQIYNRGWFSNRGASGSGAVPPQRLHTTTFTDREQKRIERFMHDRREDDEPEVNIEDSEAPQEEKAEGETVLNITDSAVQQSQAPQGEAAGSGTDSAIPPEGAHLIDESA